MSDESRGPGWWIASDGRWYPPESHPGYVEMLPAQRQRRRRQAFLRYWDRPLWRDWLAWLTVLAIVAGVLSVVRDYEDATGALVLDGRNGVAFVINLATFVASQVVLFGALPGGVRIWRRAALAAAPATTSSGVWIRRWTWALVLVVVGAGFWAVGQRDQPQVHSAAVCSGVEQEVAYVTSVGVPHVAHVTFGCEPAAVTGRCGSGRVLADIYGQHRECADSATVAGWNGKPVG